MVTKLRNEITNFRQRPDESLFEAWERYKLLIDRCPNHNMLPVTQIDTFYNGLTLRHHDTINAAAGGTFMKRRPKECYDLIENMTAHHNDWDTSAQWTTIGNTQNVYAARAYQGNTITNQKEELKGITIRSGTAYQGPTIPTTSSSLPPVTESPILNSEPVVAPIIELVVALVSAPKPNQKLLILYPSRLHDQNLRDKANDQREKFFQIFKDLNFIISFADALILMPKFGPTINTLLTNKDKLSELARTLLNDYCSVVLLKKLPEKLGDPDKFLIPCDFLGMAECLALADIGASINLMPLLVWNKLSLPDLSPTCMTLELTDRLISRPVRVAKDVFVKVGTFHFLADFVVVDFDADPQVPLILGRYFLKTGRDLIDVFEGELTLRVGKEAITFNLDQTSRYSANYNDMTANRIDVIDMAYLSVEEKAALITVLKLHKQAIAWKLFDIKGIDPEFCTHKILMEDDFEPAVQHQRMVNRKIHDVIKNEVLKLLDAGLIYPISNSPWEKSHFMVKEGIVLGHKISKNRIEVDKTKVEVIAKLPHPTTFKEKNTPFVFSEDCIRAIQTLKKKLTEAPILIAPNWDLPFELMCDASDFTIGTVLGKRHEKHFKPIHYASKTMNDAETNYTTTEKEMLAVVYAFKKFRSYLIMNKSIVHTDHSALKYLFAKKDAKARLLRWVPLLQEFDF
nr:reverse transcriptase domain-containing protein [Tanacetum cinerariifolium]